MAKHKKKSTKRKKPKTKIDLINLLIGALVDLIIGILLILIDKLMD
ncbi:MAG: hypothetical protein NC320_01060 [Clostridium sp.]|nr:hypothetical protein [Clostridium sp.]